MEIKLIREQRQYIQVLEELLEVCKEQIRTLELLAEEQNRALVFITGKSPGEGARKSPWLLCLISPPREK